jgi:selenium-binding protein 1
LRSRRDLHHRDLASSALPDPTKLEIVKIIEPSELFARTGYSRPHTIHCGPEGIYVSALGAPDGGGPGGIFLLDHYDFNVLGRWEVDRGPQEQAYDFWWHLGHDTLITSEWGTPNKIENGIDPEHLLSSGYGQQLHIWNLRARKHQQVIDLGKEHQMVLELRPSHDPTRTFGFAGVVISLKDLSASIWLWKRGFDLVLQPCGSGNRSSACARKIVCGVWGKCPNSRQLKKDSVMTYFLALSGSQPNFR